MAVVADLDALVAEGVLTPAQAAVLRARSRRAMIALVVNALLAGGVLAAAGGFVVLLAHPLAVAMGGAAFLAGGIAVLAKAGALWRMFGHAAALIGAGMLIGGGVVEAVDKLGEGAASLLFLMVGTVLALIAGAAFRRRAAGLRFVTGFLLLAGVALHLGGAYGLAFAHGVGGLPRMALHLYAFALVAGAGWLLDVRLVTALAIVPFAQMLDTSTAYFHAAYVFYAPEPTLSILQMGTTVAVCLWLMRRLAPREARHAGIVAILAFVVANLCFLVGSLWGDTVGDSFVQAALEAGGTDPDALWLQLETYRDRALHIPAGIFALIWAAALAAVAIRAAQTHQRGLFNAAMTFAAIHAYTQLFETFGDHPQVWALGGLAAIPLAWGMRQLNRRFD
ncbi:MAG: hypothetical protein ACK4S2_09160 [Gemmobacter sp.]|uniref:hypothetical protein n=1 Tax=Gemmobacter sp. TaxID=1898957 RepID=UPI0039192D50